MGNTQGFIKRLQRRFHNRHYESLLTYELTDIEEYCKKQDYDHYSIEDLHHAKDSCVRRLDAIKSCRNFYEEHTVLYTLHSVLTEYAKRKRLPTEYIDNALKSVYEKSRIDLIDSGHIIFSPFEIIALQQSTTGSLTKVEKNILFAKLEALGKVHTEKIA